MSTVAVSLEEFYQEYPEFDNEKYENICPICFRRAKNFISLTNSSLLNCEKRKTAIYLLCAHLSILSFKTSQNSSSSSQSSGLVASASVGEVSVSFVQIPTLDYWSYWLAQTSYGQELLALLDMLSATPIYIGGSLERVF